MKFEGGLLDRLMAQRRFGVKPGLQTMNVLMAELGNPQDKLKVIHIAGTNGKGSVMAILDSILCAAGFKVGRYTSPHLVSITERFFVNGKPADMGLLEEVADEVFPVVEKIQAQRNTEVTFFECLTAVMFVMFAKLNLDVVLLETGLGGRLDATNIVKPKNVLAAVITRIGLDHCQWLGNTLKAIAAEKAGIIKFKQPVVLGAMPLEASATIEKIAKRNKSEVVFSKQREYKFPTENFSLFGAFQVENEMTALSVVDLLKEKHEFEIPEDAVIRGLENVVWPGRCQKVEREGITIIIDGAHNPDGATALTRALRQAKITGLMCLVAGFCGDKNVAEHLAVMRSVADTGFAVSIRNERSLKAEETALLMKRAGFASAIPCGSCLGALANAFIWAKKYNGTVLVCGSLFLAAEALVELDAFPWKKDSVDLNEKI